MRALRRFAAAFIVGSCAALVLARDGAPRAADAERDDPHIAPIPATVGAGLVIMAGLLVARHLRRRPE